MGKVIAVLIIFALLISFTSAAYAKNMGDKLTRGVANIATGLVGEIGKNINQEWKASNNAGIGIFTGFIKGMVMGVCRMGSGVWDLLTFPIKVPKDYEPLVKPDYLISIK